MRSASGCRRCRPQRHPLLVRHFVQKHGGFGASEAVDISGDELARLIVSPGPATCAAQHGQTLDRPRKQRLPRATPAQRDPATADGQEQPPSERRRHPVQAQRTETERILDALEKHKWNRRKVSRTRHQYQTLRRRIEKLRLDRRHEVRPHAPPFRVKSGFSPQVRTCRAGAVRENRVAFSE